jgi:hypothetical protein
MRAILNHQNLMRMMKANLTHLVVMRMRMTLIVVEVINLSVKKDFPLKNLMRGLSKKIVKEIEDKWKDKEKERE